MNEYTTSSLMAPNILMNSTDTLLTGGLPTIRSSLAGTSTNFLQQLRAQKASKQMYIQGLSKFEQEIDHAYSLPAANRRLIFKHYLENPPKKAKAEETFLQHGLPLRK